LHTVYHFSSNFPFLGSYQERKSQKRKVSTGRKYYKKREAKGGWKHEDWHIVQQMKEHGRQGYLIFRLCFESKDTNDYPSLVNDASKPVPKDKVIPIIKIDESDSSISDGDE